MEPNAHDELTPGERRALDALARERMPSPLLEVRTVRALKARGLIRSSPRRPFIPASWWTASAAALIAVFASGVAVGQWLGTRETADVLEQMRRDDALASAAWVQRAGSAYVTALASLVEAADTADARVVAQAREVALAGLWAAAGEVVRLAPDDPVADEILRGFERARTEDADSTSDVPVRRVIWF